MGIAPADKAKAGDTPHHTPFELHRAGLLLDTCAVSWLSRGRRIREQVERGDTPGLPLVWRTFGGITGLVVAANIAGVIVVGLLLVAVNSNATHHQRVVVGVVGAVYGVSAIAFGAVMGFVLQGRTLKWLARVRRPTRDEARRALR